MVIGYISLFLVGIFVAWQGVLFIRDVVRIAKRRKNKSLVKNDELKGE